jgi:enterochelin esterase-like enzyme
MKKSTGAGALMRMPAVSGGTPTILEQLQGQNNCPNAITMDYPNANVYWNSACVKQIHMIRIDGTKHSLLDDGNTMLVTTTFSNGIAYYNRVIYWTDGNKIIEFSVITNSSKEFYIGSAYGIRVVRSSLQPTG